MVIQTPRARRQQQVERNRVVMEVSLVLYALVATVILSRTVLVLLGTSERVWIGRMILGVTSLVTTPMSKIPGFDGALIGPLTLVDLLLLTLVILFPLGLIATSNRR